MPERFCLTQGLLTTKGRERGTTCNGQYGEAPEGWGWWWVPFSSFRSNTRVGISLNEVCERKGREICHFSVLKDLKGYETHFMDVKKPRQLLGFLIYSYV